MITEDVLIKRLSSNKRKLSALLWNEDVLKKQLYNNFKNPLQWDYFFDKLVQSKKNKKELESKISRDSLKLEGLKDLK